MKNLSSLFALMLAIHPAWATQSRQGSLGRSTRLGAAKSQGIVNDLALHGLEIEGERVLEPLTDLQASAELRSLPALAGAQNGDTLGGPGGSAAPVSDRSSFRDLETTSTRLQAPGADRGLVLDQVFFGAGEGTDLIAAPRDRQHDPGRGGFGNGGDGAGDNGHRGDDGGSKPRRGMGIAARVVPEMDFTGDAVKYEKLLRGAFNSQAGQVALLKHLKEKHGLSSTQVSRMFFLVTTAEPLSPGETAVVKEVRFAVQLFSSRMDTGLSRGSFLPVVSVRGKLLRFDEPVSSSADAGASADIKERIKSEFDALRKSGQLKPSSKNWTKEKPEGEYHRVPMTPWRGTGDPYQYFALIPKGENPSSFWIERKGGLAGGSVYQGEFRLDVEAQAAESKLPRLEAAKKILGADDAGLLNASSGDFWSKSQIWKYTFVSLEKKSIFSLSVDWKGKLAGRIQRSPLSDQGLVRPIDVSKILSLEEAKAIASKDGFKPRSVNLTRNWPGKVLYDFADKDGKRVVVNAETGTIEGDMEPFLEKVPGAAAPQASAGFSVGIEPHIPAWAKIHELEIDSMGGPGREGGFELTLKGPTSRAVFHSPDAMTGRRGAQTTVEFFGEGDLHMGPISITKIRTFDPEGLKTLASRLENIPSSFRPRQRSAVEGLRTRLLAGSRGR